MSDLSWLNNFPSPAFAFKAEGDEPARILFWNDAMAVHSNVASELALGGKLATLTQRLLRATRGHSDTVSFGTLGTFDFKTLEDGTVIVSLRARVCEDADKEKVMFLAMAAHDLRRPLRQISDVMHEVRDGFQDMGDGKLERLQLIEDIAARARMLTNDVITYTWSAHIRQGETSRVDLSEMASQVLHSVDPSASHTLSCPDVCVDTEKLALQISLRNLFDNAIRRGGKARVHFQLFAEEENDGASLRMTVLDNAKTPYSGVDLFENATDQPKSSFGLLGVKRLIEERGGKIWVNRPDHGKGSAISFTLPGTMVSDERTSSKAG